MHRYGSTLSDAQVVHRSLENPEAFEILFDRHFQAIYSYAFRRASQCDPADIAGETFRIAFERRGTFDMNFDDALPWLYGIARNLVRRRLMQDRRRGSAQTLAANKLGAETSDPLSEVAAPLDSARELDAVLRILAVSPADSVEALRLHVWEGLSYEDIGQVLGLPIGTVRSRINRLRVRLRAELSNSRTNPATRQSI
jgi:RNA polymerase sigma-70 factor (ECF subfamily)